MFVMLRHPVTGHVSTLEADEESLLGALRILKKMRWAHVKRHGRSGSRWFTVSLRNRDEWKQGHFHYSDFLLSIVPEEE